MSGLAEDAAESLDLRGIGRLLAFTSNDEVNALSTGHFARVFGRREVFQLAPGKRRSGQSAVPDEYLGRVIGVDGLTYATVDERTRQGWKVVGSPAGALIVSAFEEQQFIPVARIEDGEMAFICRNDPLPETGDVIGLASPAVQRSVEARAATGTETSNGDPADAV
jgi:hypothetical protein